MAGDLVRDLLHGQLLVRHPLAVKLQSEKPGGDTGGVKVRHLIVDIDKLLVFSHNCIEGLGVIVDGRVGRHLAQSCVLNTTQNILDKSGHNT